MSSLKIFHIQGQMCTVLARFCKDYDLWMFHFENRRREKLRILCNSETENFPPTGMFILLNYDFSIAKVILSHILSILSNLA